jgi:copper chaperone NosL
MKRRRAVRLGALMLVAACAAAGPQAIMYGVDVCAFCKMQIAERRFAAEIVTTHGRIVKFDSIECLLASFKDARARQDVASVWVSDFRHPGVLLEATNARFFDLGPGRTPMGRGWVAVASARDAAALGIIDASAIKRWTELQ